MNKFKFLFFFIFFYNILLSGSKIRWLSGGIIYTSLVYIAGYIQKSLNFNKILKDKIIEINNDNSISDNEKAIKLNVLNSIN